MLALDLSLAGLGMAACAATLGWQPDAYRFRTLRSDPTETGREHARRIIGLARGVGGFAEEVGATRVFAEDVDHVPRERVKQMKKLLELRGLVIAELETRLGLELVFAKAQSVRKLVYGMDAPRKVEGRKITDAERKRWLLDPLLGAGFELLDHNQGDACALLQWGLREMGRAHFSSLVCLPDEKRKKRS